MKQVNEPDMKRNDRARMLINAATADLRAAGGAAAARIRRPAVGLARKSTNAGSLLLVKREGGTRVTSSQTCKQEHSSLEKKMVCF